MTAPEAIELLKLLDYCITSSKRRYYAISPLGEQEKLTEEQLIEKAQRAANEILELWKLETD